MQINSKRHNLILLFIIVLTFCGLTVNAQKSPTMMILPSDNWCFQRYFYTEYDNQGVTVRIPNYQQAFQEDTEIGAVISKIGELMTEQGYTLKDAEMLIKNIAVKEGEDNVTLNSHSGSQLAESPLDILKRRAKADVVVQIGWVLNGKSLSFTIEAFDAYTSKRIATSTITGIDFKEDIPMTLQNAVKKQLKPFCAQLKSHQRDIQHNGREIVLTIRKWDDWDKDLESEFNGEELLTLIQLWLAQQTINGVFSLSDASENFAQFEQVMIPLTDSNGLDMDGRAFARSLQKYLSSNYNIPSKIMMRGLGDAILVLGEK